MRKSEFNFKSSGIRQTDRQFTPKSKIERSIGIKTPMTLGDDIITMHTNPIRQIADNFRNLIMTNHGERLGLFDFGANLNALAFEYGNAPNFEKIAGEAIIEAAGKYIPSITITDVIIVDIDKGEKNRVNELGLAKITVRVEYVIPRLNSPKLAIEVSIQT